MSKVAKAAIGLMAATLVAKMLGFGRELTLAAYYGASSTSDAFLVAMNIPAVIFTAVGTSLGTAFIPLFCEVRSKDGDSASVKYTNNIFNVVILICLIFAIVGAFFAPQIVKLFALGFKGETMEKAIYFTRINNINNFKCKNITLYTTFWITYRAFGTIFIPTSFCHEKRL